ncbi:MAG: energy transducer TonB [Bacteroidales bacterium]|jgi:protein TonB|nr:energy transducer TonB [Bacteroidales bacterium]
MKSKDVLFKIVVTFLFFFGFAYNGIAQTDTDTNTNAGTNTDTDTIVFTVTEKMPEFPGGNEALLKYFQENLTYPEDARKEKIEARIIVQFIVEPDGSLTNIKIMREHQYESLNKEAIRIIENMPKWIPAKQRGKRVRCRFLQPITFKIQQ